MLNIVTGEKMIDYLTDARRLAERNPEVGAQLDAVKQVRTVAEELLHQGSFYNLMQDASKMGMPLASLPQEVFLALSTLHPEWFCTLEGKKDFIAWLNRNSEYRYYKTTIGAVKH